METVPPIERPVEGGPFVPRADRLDPLPAARPPARKKPSWIVHVRPGFWDFGEFPYPDGHKKLIQILETYAQGKCYLWACNDRLAEDANLKERHLQTTLAEMERSGLIFRVPSDPGQPGRVGIVLRWRADPAQPVADTPELLTWAIASLKEHREAARETLWEDRDRARKNAPDGRGKTRPDRARKNAPRIRGRFPELNEVENNVSVSVVAPPVRDPDPVARPDPPGPGPAVGPEAPDRPPAEAPGPASDQGSGGPVAPSPAVKPAEPRPAAQKALAAPEPAPGSAPATDPAWGSMALPALIGLVAGSGNRAAADALAKRLWIWAPDAPDQNWQAWFSKWCRALAEGTLAAGVLIDAYELASAYDRADRGRVFTGLVKRFRGGGPSSSGPAPSASPPAGSARDLAGPLAGALPRAESPGEGTGPAPGPRRPDVRPGPPPSAATLGGSRAGVLATELRRWGWAIALTPDGDVSYEPPARWEFSPAQRDQLLGYLDELKQWKPQLVALLRAEAAAGKAPGSPVAPSAPPEATETTPRVERATEPPRAASPPAPPGDRGPSPEDGDPPPASGSMARIMDRIQRAQAAAEEPSPAAAPDPPPAGELTAKQRAFLDDLPSELRERLDATTEGRRAELLDLAAVDPAIARGEVGQIPPRPPEPKAPPAAVFKP